MVYIICTPNLELPFIQDLEEFEKHYRLVYKWFYLIYKLSYGLGIVGYVIMVATFFGLNVVFDAKPQSWMDVALLFLFYGLYYGVLAQDVAEISSDKMASHIGVRLFSLLYQYFYL